MSGHFATLEYLRVKGEGIIVANNGDFHGSGHIWPLSPFRPRDHMGVAGKQRQMMGTIKVSPRSLVT